MKVVIVEPNKHPYGVEIQGGLETMQRLVGGNIEAIYPDHEAVAYVCNEEGKLRELPLNRALTDENNKIYDIVAGTFLVCGIEHEEFVSLTPEQVQRYKEKFHSPQMFSKINGNIIALPIQPKNENIRATKNKEIER